MDKIDLDSPVWMDLDAPQAIAIALAKDPGDLTESIDRVFARYELVGDVEGAERFALALAKEPNLKLEMQTFPQRTRLLFAREVMDELPLLSALAEAPAAALSSASAQPELS